MAGGNKYFEWIAECCKELHWDIGRGAELIEDPSWFGCYDDGMTAASAVEEAVSKGIVKPSKALH